MTTGKSEILHYSNKNDAEAKPEDKRGTQAAQSWLMKNQNHGQIVLNPKKKERVRWREAQ